MKRKFKVSIGDKNFFVEVEEVSVIPVSSESLTQRLTATPKSVIEELKPEKSKFEKAVLNSEVGFIRAPLPGVVLSVNCNVGDEVKSGDLILTLEAMKMKNEVYAPKAGVVRKVNVSPGAKVNYGDIMVEIG